MLACARFRALPPRVSGRRGCGRRARGVWRARGRGREGRGRWRTIGGCGRRGGGKLVEGVVRIHARRGGYAGRLSAWTYWAVCLERRRSRRLRDVRRWCGGRVGVVRLLFTKGSWGDGPRARERGGTKTRTCSRRVRRRMNGGRWMGRVSHQHLAFPVLRLVPVEIRHGLNNRPREVEVWGLHTRRHAPALRRAWVLVLIFLLPGFGRGLALRGRGHDDSGQVWNIRRVVDRRGIDDARRAPCVAVPVGYRVEVVVGCHGLVWCAIVKGRGGRACVPGDGAHARTIVVVRRRGGRRVPELCMQDGRRGCGGHCM